MTASEASPLTAEAHAGTIGLIIAVVTEGSRGVGCLR